MTRITRVWTVVVALLVQLPVHASSLFTIGPDSDPFPVPRELAALSTSGVPSDVATLPDGSFAYNGGLAFRPAAGGDPDLLFAIANDGFAQSTLYRFEPDGGNLTPVLSLGMGFAGGLAYDPVADVLYAIQTDFFTPSTLYKVEDIGTGGSPSLSAVGAGLSGLYGGGAGGGLTFDENNGKLFGIAWDAFGVPRTLNEIDPAAGTDTPRFELGTGDAFNGGIAYDPAGDFFYGIANDFSANSTLTTFTLPGAGVVSAVGPSFGQGFLNAGLALAPNLEPPPPQRAPEPSTLGLMLLGVAALGGVSGRRLTANALA